jgi:hypothetical protein
MVEGAKSARPVSSLSRSDGEGDREAVEGRRRVEGWILRFHCLKAFS